MLICDTRLSHRQASAMFTLPYALKLITIDLAMCNLPIALVNSIPPQSIEPKVSSERNGAYQSAGLIDFLTYRDGTTFQHEKLAQYFPLIFH